MIKVEVEGIIKEIIYRSEKSCKFILAKENEELLCTITRRDMDLAGVIEEGKSFKVKGTIKAFTKVNDKGRYINNVFYVDDIEKGEDK